MKHYEKRRGVSGKLFVMMLALVLVFGCAVGGTIAWLTAETDPVVNTFTYGDINITLAETTGNDYKIIPGKDIAKNPKVTVKADSEDCWLFVKVEEKDWPTFTEKDAEGNDKKKVSYEIASDWKALPNVPGVYYREVSSAKADAEFPVLKDNKVTVSENLLKTEVSSLATAGTQPKLTFTAYAVQKDGINSAADAWEKVKPATVIS